MMRRSSGYSDLTGNQRLMLPKMSVRCLLRCQSLDQSAARVLLPESIFPK